MLYFLYKVEGEYMGNKKGFAISVVLYTMVILIVGIFYLLLGIVRNRYFVEDDLKQVIIDDIEDIEECTDWIQTSTIYTDECTSYGNANIGTSYSTCSSSPVWKFTKYSSQCSANVIEYSSGYSYNSFSAAETACYNYVFTDCPQDSANDCAWDSAYIKRTYSRTCRYRDEVKPVCNFVSGPSNSSINVSSTATYVLECTDNKGGFSDSEIVASDFTLTSSGVVTIQTPVAESIENGFRYTITVTGKNAGTTSLKLNEGAVSDTAGNDNVSVASNSITVKSSSGSTQSYPSTGIFTQSCNGTTYSQEMSTSSDCALSSVKIEYYLDEVLVKTTNVPIGTSNAVYYTLTFNGEGKWRYRITAVDVCGKTDIVADSYVIPDDCP